MIGEEIKKIREEEETAMLRVSQAEKDSKRKIEESKKKIIAEIDRKRAELIAHIEKLKKKAYEDAEKDAEHILAGYREKAAQIKDIGLEKINQLASEITAEFVR